MKIKLLTILIAFFISGVTFANYPDGFNAEMMRECITPGGASSDYQVRQKEGRPVVSTEEPEETEEEPDCD